MENKRFTVTTKQITAIVSVLLAVAGGELAIGTALFESDSDRIFVGFFVDEQTGRLKFQHTDSKIYQPFFDQKSKRYFILLDDGNRIWCY